MKFIIVYWVLINMIGIMAMFSDKERAVRHNWRIPERVLFLIALLGGSIGSIIGMWAFRHKIRHWYFVIGMPVILFLQIVLMIVIKNS